MDEGFLHSVVSDLGLGKEDTVVEVGTGAGTLTRVLSQYVKRVITFEVDRRLEKILKEQFRGIDNIELRFEDAMQSTFDESHKVVANIPYYITTPLVMKFLNNKSCESICVLVQKEVAERIVAKPGNKNYGSLSVGIQARATAKILKTVSRGVFTPPPDVDSAFVLISTHTPSALSGIHPSNLEGNFSLGKPFDTFLKDVFSKRRKKLSNIIPVKDDRRPEELCVSEFVEIYRKLFDKKSI